MQDLGIVLIRDGKTHLYEQIYNYICEAIRDGSLRTQERLPSTRMLAGSLQVSRSTVELAYDQLLSEGYIESRAGSGYYVCDVEGLLSLHSEAGNKLRSDESESLSDQRPDEQIEQSQIGPRKSADPSIIDFSPRWIEMSKFPYSTWKRITRNTLVDARSEMFELGDAQGDPALRETIAHYLHLSRGVNCSPDQIIVGAGNDYLLLLLSQILGDGRKIAMESPTYLRAFRILESLGCEVHTVEMDEEGMIPESLMKSDCNLAYVMPAHQFPTGALMPIARRLKLLKWASEKKERYLIEDDYDAEFRYHGRTIPAMQSLDHSGKVIYIGTFSKSIAPAIRVGYMVLPYSLLHRYRKKCFFYANTVSRIDQSILYEFMAEGYYERYLNKMRVIYRARHDLLVQQLRQLREKFTVRGAGAGLHLVLEEKNFQCSDCGMEQIIEREQALRKSALDQKVQVYCTSDYYIPDFKSGEIQRKAPCILLGYGALDEENIVTGVQRLCEAFL